MKTILITLCLVLTSCVITDKEYERQLVKKNNKIRFLENQLFNANDDINFYESALDTCRDSLYTYLKNVLIEETMSENDSIVVKSIVFRKWRER